MNIRLHPTNILKLILCWAVFYALIILQYRFEPEVNPSAYVTTGIMIGTLSLPLQKTTKRYVFAGLIPCFLLIHYLWKFGPHLLLAPILAAACMAPYFRALNKSTDLARSPNT